MRYLVWKQKGRKCEIKWDKIVVLLADMLIKKEKVVLLS